MTLYKGMPGEWRRPQEKEEGVEAVRTGSGQEKGLAKFYAEVAKVQTMADGGVRVVLDLGEDGRKVVEFLVWCKQKGIVLDIDAVTRKG